MGKPKRYVLFAGDTYYPAGGWDDYHGSYETIEEAKAEIKKNRKLQFGWDWWQIVDLETGREVDS